MKRIFPLLLLLFTIKNYAQLDANALMRIPDETTSNITATTGSIGGLLAYSNDENVLYFYNGTSWVSLTSAADLLDSNINLSTAIDVNNVNTDPGAVNETTVKEVIDAIAPITSKAARIFYPPSIAINASSTGTGRTLELYDDYLTQFGSPMVSSTNAPNSIPTYTATELYYYVTAYDTSILTITGIDENGQMTYNVDNIPTDDNTIINVVFVVK